MVSKGDIMKRLDYMKSIWVVGASSGIGLALAQSLAAADRTLFISARNLAALEAAAAGLPGTVVPLALDVTDSRSVAAAAKQIEAHTGALDMVIINAGTCEYIDSREIEINIIKRVMDTNFQGALQVMDAALPLLRKAKKLNAEKGVEHQPQLVVVSSSVTYQALPRAGAYGASKAALRYFTECLKLDLQHEGIDVRLVSPGFVKTPLTDKNDFPMPFIVSQDYAANAILKGLNSKTFDIKFPSRFTALLKLVALFPDALRFKWVGKMSRHTQLSDIAKTGSEW